MKPGRPAVQSGHVLRKRFGQHFLRDEALVEQMLDLVGIGQSDHVLEIGPGLGAMTLPLLQRVNELTVIEVDRDLIARWQRNPQVRVIAQDVLQVDIAQWAQGYADEGRRRVVGNLPYNISSPILFHLMPFAHVVHDQHFMLQKEVVERMVAIPGTAAYGRLSVMLQWRYQMEWILEVPPSAFHPPPKVDSAVVRMVPRAFTSEQLKVAKTLSTLVQVAFSQRRKVLRNTLEPWLTAKGVQANGFDMRRRAEEVGIAEYTDLAQAVVDVEAANQ